MSSACGQSNCRARARPDSLIGARSEGLDGALRSHPPWLPDRSYRATPRIRPRLREGCRAQRDDGSAGRDRLQARETEPFVRGQIHQRFGARDHRAQVRFGHPLAPDHALAKLQLIDQPRQIGSRLQRRAGHQQCEVGPPRSDPGEGADQHVDVTPLMHRTQMQQVRPRRVRSHSETPAILQPPVAPASRADAGRNHRQSCPPGRAGARRSRPPKSG